jgi:hypothetical protein
MSRPAQKNWFRREGKDEEPAVASAAESDGPDLPTKRIAAYMPAQKADSSGIAPEEDGAHDGAAEAEPLPARSAGEQVDAILQTARDTAAKLTAAATEEAERTRAEARSAATREVETARRRVESDREKAAKERADAEAYAARLRSEAETVAERLRVDAEHAASTLLESARDTARERVASLAAETKRHEERLEQLLEASRNMASEIEDALGRKGARGPDIEPAYHDLGEELLPNASSETAA